MLSAALKRDVTLEAIERSDSPRASNKEISEEYWLDMEGLEHRDTVTDFNLPEGTLFSIRRWSTFSRWPSSTVVRLE